MEYLEATVEFSVELIKFVNVDLFNRGYYQIRAEIESDDKLKIDARIHRYEDIRKKPVIVGNVCQSQTFFIEYKHSQTNLHEVFIFQVSFLVDPNQPIESINNADIRLRLSVWADTTGATENGRTRPCLREESSRVLRLHCSVQEGLHSASNVLFDFHTLCAISLIIHGQLWSINQPSIWFSEQSTSANPNGLISGDVEHLLFGRTLQPGDRLEMFDVHRIVRICNAVFYTLLLAQKAAISAIEKHNVYFPNPVNTEEMQFHIGHKLSMYTTKIKMSDCADDLVGIVGSTLASLSAEVMVLWHEYLKNSVPRDPNLKLEDSMVTDYHQMLVKKFSEAFFSSEKPKVLATTSSVILSDTHLQISEMLRAHNYLRNLPPFAAECLECDLNPANLPIIFEERYVENPESCPLKLTPTQEDLKNMNLVSRSRLRQGKQPHKIHSRSKRMVNKAQKEHIKSLSSSSIDLRYPTSPPSAVHTPRVHKTGPDGDTRLSSSVRLPHNKPVVLTGFRMKDDVELPSIGTRSYFGIGSNDAMYLSTERLALLRHRTRSVPSLVDDDPEKGGNTLDSPSAIASPASEQSPFHNILNDTSYDDDDYDIVEGVQCSQARKLLYHLTDAHQFFQWRNEAKRLLAENHFKLRWYSDWSVSQLACPLPYFSDQHEDCSNDVHLVVCVHGLDGNYQDLRTVKNYILLGMGLPSRSVKFLMSKINEGFTFESFEIMTKKLVQEIMQYIDSVQHAKITRISFIGHSLGAVLTRAVLAHPEFEPCLKYLHTYLSLAGPHLGIGYTTSALVSTGMWFMQKMKKSNSLLQLQLKDCTGDLTDTFIYRLSTKPGLQFFKNVLLVASHQDKYVPLHSARIELCDRAIKDESSFGITYRRMVENILAPIISNPDLTFIRYDVSHCLSSSTTNNLIGRTAHIAVLDSEPFLEKFFTVVGLQFFT